MKWCRGTVEAGVNKATVQMERGRRGSGPPTLQSELGAPPPPTCRGLSHLGAMDPWAGEIFALRDRPELWGSSAASLALTHDMLGARGPNVSRYCQSAPGWGPVSYSYMGTSELEVVPHSVSLKGKTGLHSAHWISQSCPSPRKYASDLTNTALLNTTVPFRWLTKALPTGRFTGQMTSGRREQAHRPVRISAL